MNWAKLKFGGWLPMRSVAALTAIGLLVGGASAEADPLSAFLHAISHRHYRRAASHHHRTATPTVQDTTNPEVSAAEPIATAAPSPVARRMVVSQNPASVQPAKKVEHHLPAGLPVAKKPGFVKSPYAQNDALIDVRGFPSGTEVTDPYTGKIFVTP